LTNQLLAFSHRQIMQPRVISLNVVIGQTENMLRRLIGEDIELVMNLGADTGNIRTDPHHIEQAIVNLAVNAAMPCLLAGGSPSKPAIPGSMKPTPRPTWGFKPGEFVMIAVSDTGARHGFRNAAEDLRTVFFTPSHAEKAPDLALPLFTAW